MGSNCTGFFKVVKGSKVDPNHVEQEILGKQQFDLNLILHSESLSNEWDQH